MVKEGSSDYKKVRKRCSLKNLWLNGSLWNRNWFFCDIAWSGFWSTLIFKSVEQYFSKTVFLWDFVFAMVNCISKDMHLDESWEIPVYSLWFMTLGLTPSILCIHWTAVPICNILGVKHCLFGTVFVMHIFHSVGHKPVFVNLSHDSWSFHYQCCFKAQSNKGLLHEGILRNLIKSD